ncbi:TetR/AcrR family transcriptional regulator [Pseudocolwellia sp. AS88]|uniref:TetR/AcrR family transcriptional regulator n=1 Tax=Pseudocolwellia sp. AS88 TaxID=3063958 RepID=UPI0026EFB03E|nr:TetR/AcrR family transcriptional regulator [Pseudocolwellia sp. AS88]MDO7083475.1 TetR/AcrR family transcriptional regulator [Pseudocolwellia sp. AS88]
MREKNKLTKQTHLQQKEQNIKTTKQGSIREKSQDKILAAAQEEFIIQGYKGATVQAIADRAKLPKANVLYYFKNKENIYHAVLERTLAMWDDAIGDIDPDHGPAVAIEKFIASKVQLSFKEPDASKIYAMEIIQGAQHLKDFTRTYLRKWVRDKTALFQHWIDKGEMNDVDPVHLIFLIWSTTQHYADFDNQILTVMNQADFEEEDCDRVTAFLTDFILRGCGLKKD